MTPVLPNFPPFNHLSTKDKIADLVRLTEADLTKNVYVYGRGISNLLAKALYIYRDHHNSPEWENDAFVQQSIREKRKFHLFIAALFDLACNIEYLHDRVVNSKWIYCRRDDQNQPHVFYSFLKQCPRCCLDRGLEQRLAGAQHKPSSHHIGEITTTATALLLKLIASSESNPLHIAVITKQSHDVDAIGYNSNLIVLFEIKSSPMVTFPLYFDLEDLLYYDKDGVPTEYRQHSLVDVVIDYSKVALFIPHRNLSIKLPKDDDPQWPYKSAIKAFSEPSLVLAYFSAWLELFYAYRIPKTQRPPRIQSLTYLVNGWGDEIDSNKTKPGLGRTDDIKKGTYQLIKFGAYYNDENANLPVRGVLAANLDPLFLREAYFDKLQDIRWGQNRMFQEEDGFLKIRKEHLYYLYNAVIAFNNPVLNDPLTEPIFNIERTEHALKDGNLNYLLNEWAQGEVDVRLL